MYSKQLEFLEAIYFAVKESANEIQYDESNRHHLILISLYATIIEYSFSCITLLKTNQYTAIPTILRSTLEASTDLLILIKEKEYADSMYLSFLHQKIQIIKKIIDKASHAQFVIDNLDKFRAELASTKIEFGKKKSVGVKLYQPFQKFDLADIDQIYILYQNLCRESHNNLDCLIHRHITDNCFHFNITLFASWDEADIIFLISCTIRFLVNSFRKIQEYFLLNESYMTLKVIELFFSYEEYEKKLYEIINQDLAT